MSEIYKLTTNFNEGTLPDEDGYNDKNIFHKKLELLCLEYDVDISYE